MMIDKEGLLHFGKDSLIRLGDVMAWPLNTAGKVGVTLDWKSFDSTIPPWLIKLAFEVVWSTYEFKNDRSRDKYRRIFNFIIECFINTKIMLADGSVY